MTRNIYDREEAAAAKVVRYEEEEADSESEFTFVNSKNKTG